MLSVMKILIVQFSLKNTICGCFKHTLLLLLLTYGTILQRGFASDSPLPNDSFIGQHQIIERHRKRNEANATWNNCHVESKLY